MNIFNTDLMTKVNILKAAIDKADTLIIGVNSELAVIASNKRGKNFE
jgi:hypothetical protein